MTTRDKNTYDINQYRKMVENRKVYLSLIVPSYNEEQRLPVMLNETMEVYTVSCSISRREISATKSSL